MSFITDILRRLLFVILVVPVAITALMTMLAWLPISFILFGKNTTEKLDKLGESVLLILPKKDRKMFE